MLGLGSRRDIHLTGVSRCTPRVYISAGFRPRYTPADIRRDIRQLLAEMYTSIHKYREGGREGGMASTKLGGRNTPAHLWREGRREECIMLLSDKYTVSVYLSDKYTVSALWILDSVGMVLCE